MTTKEAHVGTADGVSGNTIKENEKQDGGPYFLLVHFDTSAREQTEVLLWSHSREEILSIIDTYASREKELDLRTKITELTESLYSAKKGKHGRLRPSSQIAQIREGKRREIGNIQHRLNLIAISRDPTFQFISLRERGDDVSVSVHSSINTWWRNFYEKQKPELDHLFLSDPDGYKTVVHYFFVRGRMLESPGVETDAINKSFQDQLPQMPESKLESLASHFHSVNDFLKVRGA